MATDAAIGYGTLFQLADENSPSAYTTLAEVTNITPPAYARDAVDATHMQSPEGWREFIAGLKDAGEASVEMNFIPGNGGHDRIMAAFDSDDALSCRIIFVNGVVWTFNAICTGFEPEAPIDDKMMATVTFKISGKPTLV